MKTSTLICLCLFFFTALPAQAQWRNLPKAWLRKETKQAQSLAQEAASKELAQTLSASYTKAAGAVSAQEGKALRELGLSLQADPQFEKIIAKKLKERAVNQAKKQDNNIQLSVFKAQEKRAQVLQETPPFAATGFVFEEVYEGEKYIWGATAKHVVDIVGKEFDAVFYDHGKEVLIPVKAVQLGNQETMDAALILFPPEAEKIVRPFKLGTASVGEKTESFGYTQTGFHHLQNRTVMDVFPMQFKASLHFSAKDRAGMCGGPLLNAQKEAVGVYCGSSKTQEIGYAVQPVVLQDLLYAYHHNGSCPRVMKFNDKTLGLIDINQTIRHVSSHKDWQMLDFFVVDHRHGNIDYNHLEKLVNTRGAEYVEIMVTRTIESGESLNTPVKQISFILNLKTGSLRREEFVGKVNDYY